MPAVTVRDLSGEAYFALRARAALNRRSLEGEVRHILETAVRPQRRPPASADTAARIDDAAE